MFNELILCLGDNTDLTDRMVAKVCWHVSKICAGSLSAMSDNVEDKEILIGQMRDAAQDILELRASYN